MVKQVSDENGAQGKQLRMKEKMEWLLAPLFGEVKNTYWQFTVTGMHR